MTETAAATPQRPAGMCLGPGHMIVYGNPAFVAVFGRQCVGLPARETMLSLPAEAFDLLDGRLDRTGFLAVNVARNVAFARRQRTWFRADAFGDAQLELDAAADPFQAAFEASRRFLAGEPVS